MSVSRLQAVLSIMIVAVFLLVTGIIALTPAIGGYPAEDYTEHLKTFSSLYSGIVGLVVGFFFGKRANEGTDKQ